MIRFLARHAYAIALAVLISALLVVGAFLVAVALPDIDRALRPQDVSVEPSAAPSVTPSEPPGYMSWLGVPASAECSGCHLTDGGVIGLRSTPVIAHPLKGWDNCTECHAPQRLVETAPGHAGIHADACLTCHETTELPDPISRPHREWENSECLDCHGTRAPLPEDMAHRPESVCWLCHRLPAEQPPVPAHGTEANQSDCLTCHSDEGPAGALRPDHSSREPTQCLLCHAPPAGEDRVGLRLSPDPGLAATRGRTAPGIRRARPRRRTAPCSRAAANWYA